MSGLEVIAAIKTCADLLELAGRTAHYIIEFTEAARDYNTIVKELASKLKLLGTIFKLFQRAAKRVRDRQYISSEDDMINEAASIIQENIVACQRTLTLLLSKQPKPLKEYHASSFLRGAVKYLVYDIEGRPIIESGLRDIDDRIKSMEIALRFIQTDYVFDIHDAVDGDARRPSLAPTLVSPGSQANYQDVSPVSTRVDDEIFNRTNVESNAIPESPQFSSTLKHGIDKVDVGTISDLLRHKHDPLAQDKDGWCALHYAARTNNVQVCQVLINSERIHGSEGGIETRNCTGATPLHFAASIGSLKTVRILLDAGADPHAVDHYNRSPLFMASEGNHVKMVELLLASGAEIPSDAPMRLKELQCAINWRNRKAKKLKAKGRISTDTIPAYY
ncbi:ankyrin repeat domain-containing protein [Aspergillus tanneri]|uniref:Uncharacterized protein n=1 Tax=Aspergillus tanneri TaxID=1220188 RepID=A0A5M9MRY1_9EURO|nr:uncharacterized protein ATNIH1004_004561 [Aspergillus tanneri]KAA8648676.1 hypothetical protein ATNIH1004_004561 [Aspergillus tanneri]